MKIISIMPDDAKQFVKRPIPVRAVQINEYFAVWTPEGRMKGQPGDYLMEGIEGELYICAYAIFKKSYTPFFNEDDKGNFPDASEI